MASRNLNSLRVRLGALDRTRPDVLLLQETKTATVSSEAGRSFTARGYEAVAIGAGGYNGVAIAARHPLVDVINPGSSERRRSIASPASSAR